MYYRVCGLLDARKLDSFSQCERVFKSLKLSRKKLAWVWETYMTQKHSSEFAVGLPVQFQRGRFGYGIMSDPQVEDLRTHCLRMETLGFAMTTSQLNECLTRFKLFNCGIFRTFEEFSVPTIEHYVKLFSTSTTFKTFRARVRRLLQITDSEEKTPKRRAGLRGMSQVEMQCCTPWNVRQDLEEWVAVCKHVGAIDGNDVVIDPELMWTCGGKSFDCRKNTGFTGVAVATKPVLQCGRLKAGHLSALGFGNAAGDFLPPGVVANGQKWHPDFQTIFPETTVCVADNGSVTKHSFVQLCEEVFVEALQPTHQADVESIAVGQWGRELATPIA